MPEKRIIPEPVEAEQPLSDDTLSQVFVSVRASLNRDMRFATFFFSLDSLRWAIRFQGIEAHGDAEAGNFITDQIAEYLAETGVVQGVEDVREIVRRISSDPNWPASRLHAGAIHILSRLAVPLGWYGSDAEDASREPVWDRRCVDYSVSLKGFQIALAHAFRNVTVVSAERTVLGSATAQLARHGDISEIRHYMTIPRLFDAHSIEVFVAEYLFATGGNGDIDPAEMSLSFLPLAALGQWRASVCWITFSEAVIGTRSHIVTPSLKTALQELCSMSLVNAFCAQLGEAIVQRMNRNASFDVMLRAFASLWWAEEVVFLCEGKPVVALARDEAGSLTEVPAASGYDAPRREISTEVISIVWQEEGCSGIDLNFDFPDLPAREVRTLLGFDRVAMSVRLFDADLFSQQIKHILVSRILSVLQMHRAQFSLVEAQRRMERMATIEAVGHTMKNTVKALGWRHALRKIHELAPQHDPEVKDALEEAARSLSLFSVVEGAGELLRVASAADQRELGKLRVWTSDEAVASWNSADPALFRRYTSFIVLFLRTVFYGTLARDGFVLTVRGSQGTQRMRVDTARRPEGALEDWIRRYGPLLPLLANRDIDSHVAMLSTLIEPAYNAIKWVHSHQGGGSIHIGICNSLPRSVDVTITNRGSGDETGMPQGLRMTDHLMRMSFLGSVSKSPAQTTGSATNLFSVRISMTPDRLCRRILDAAKEQMV